MHRIPLLICALVAGLLTTAPAATAVPPDPGCPTPVAPARDGSTYLISTAAQFQWIKADTTRWDETYRQTADIDFTGCTWTTTIGTSTLFTGRYDGGGFTINNLSINAGAAGGVFGTINGAGVPTNVHLRNVTSTSTGDNVGLLVDALYGTLSSSSATGSITGNGNVGGLAGGVIGGGSHVGILEDSYANVTVRATSAGGGAGGLAGALSPGATVRRTFASGTVTGAQIVGGLIGSSTSISTLVPPDPPIAVEDSYATGTVTASTSGAGGLVGYPIGTTIRRSYAVGAVIAPTIAGGFAGSGTPTDNANFWDTQTSGQSAAGQSASATGKTTAEMMRFSTFADAGWSITNGYSTSTTWGICPQFNNGYPFLVGTQTGDVCAQASAANPEIMRLTFTPGDGFTCTINSVTGTRGTWVELPKSDACSPADAASTSTLLGWATRSDFPTDIAQRQVDNGWGAYELTDDTRQITAVFIPAGGSTFLSRDNTLYAIWG